MCHCTVDVLQSTKPLFVSSLRKMLKKLKCESAQTTLNEGKEGRKEGRKANECQFVRSFVRSLRSDELAVRRCCCCHSSFVVVVVVVVVAVRSFVRSIVRSFVGCLWLASVVVAPCRVTWSLEITGVCRPSSRGASLLKWLMFLAVPSKHLAHFSFE